MGAIHSSIFYRFSEVRLRGGSSFCRKAQTSLSQATSSSILGLPWDLLLEGRAQTTSPARRLVVLFKADEFR